MADLKFWQDLNAMSATGQTWVGSQASSYDYTPPGTGASTPLPPCVVGMSPQGKSPLSSGENTPPERENMQHLLKLMEASRGCKMPLKPGLVDEPTVMWPLSFPGPPGLLQPRPDTPTRPASQLVPPPPAPASAGSVGHPDRCAEACKYVKRKMGCLMGDSCPQCHLCFWQRRSTGTSRSSASGAVGISCVADFAGQSKSTEVDSEKDSEKATAQDSIGSRGHPESCGEACRYVKRKGGCRNGSSCPDCHLCTWRRNPAVSPPQQVGLGEKTVPGFDFGARKQLQHLIRIQLEAEVAESPPQQVAGVLTPPRARTAAQITNLSDELQADKLKAIMQAVGPPPGLEPEDGRLLSTNFPSLISIASAAR